MLNSHKIRARRQQGSSTAHAERCSSSVCAVTGHSTHMCGTASVSTALSTATPLGLEACVITALRGSCCSQCSHAGAAGGVVILGLLALLAALLVRRKRRHARSAAPRLAVPFSFSRSDSGSDKVRGTRELSSALQGLRLRVQALEGLRPLIPKPKPLKPAAGWRAVPSMLSFCGPVYRTRLMWGGAAGTASINEAPARLGAMLARPSLPLPRSIWQALLLSELKAHPCVLQFRMPHPTIRPPTPACMIPYWPMSSSHQNAAPAGARSPPGRHLPRAPLDPEEQGCGPAALPGLPGRLGHARQRAVSSPAPRQPHEGPPQRPPDLQLLHRAQGGQRMQHCQATACGPARRPQDP